MPADSADSATAPAAEKTLCLLDGMALIYRAYFAFINNPRVTSTGVNTSAIFGFLNTVMDLDERLKPTHLAVVFDTPEPTQRHVEFPAYKAQREAMPEDLSASIPEVDRLLGALRIPVLRRPGFEADDIIGTLAQRAEREGFMTFMITPDKDFAQLVHERIRLYRPLRDGVEVLDVPGVCSKYEIASVDQVRDLLGLMGDTADNIPGIPGIGPKTAQKLIAQYGTIENLIAHADELKGAQKEKVQTFGEQALLSKRLATIIVDVPVTETLDSFVRVEPDLEVLRNLFQLWEFRNIGRRWFGDDFAGTAGLAGAGVVSSGAAGAGGAAARATAKASEKAAAKAAAAARAMEGDLFAPAPVAPAPASAAAGADDAATPGPTAQTILADAGTSRQSARGGAAIDDAGTGESDVDDEGAGTAAGDGDGEGDGDGGGEVDLFGGVAQVFRTLADTPHDYRIVDTPVGIAALVQELLGHAEVVFDLETTSLDAKLAEIVGVAFAVAAHAGWYVPVPADPVAAAAVLDLLRPFFAAANVAKVGQNIKYDLSVLKWQGVVVRGEIMDTMIAHALIAPEMRHGMDYLSETLLGYAPQPITALIGTGKVQLSMRDVPVADVAEYAAEDADVTWQLWQIFRAQLVEFQADRVFRTVEAPLVPVLVDMEYEGIRLDAPSLGEFSLQLGEEIGVLETRLYEAAGREFNVDSPKQLGEILFDQLKLDPKAKKTRKTGQYKTSEDVLLTLAGKHVIVRDILAYRQARKLKSTYVDSLPNDVSPRTGRVHTTYGQAFTATGRMASTNPNLQNIPVRSEHGKEIRKAFVARDDDHLLMAADYSQIELRIIAHISGDAGLREAFHQAQDIHTATAARIYQVPLDDVIPEMRRKAKMVNFGIAYGISAFGLSQRLGIGRQEAAEIIENYFTQFPGVRTYIDTTINLAREYGYVETMLGRRRYLRDINSRNATARGAAERNAINAPIQGSAADMIKLAMIRVHKCLVNGGFATRMLLQVHDELVFDLRRDEAGAVVPLVREAMAGALPLAVPVVVDIGLGKNWLEAH